MNQVLEPYWPLLCGHCSKHATNPPAVVRMLEVFSGGSGKVVYHTITSASKQLGVSRQAVAKLFQEGIRHGYVKAITNTSNTYERTERGTQLWSRWIQSGYTSPKKRRQRSARRKA